MAKLADAPDLGSGAARRVGSTPIIRTKSQSEGGSERGKKSSLSLSLSLSQSHSQSHSHSHSHSHAVSFSFVKSSPSSFP